MIVSGVAGRYAAALFELAREAGQLDAVAIELEELEATVRGSADLTRLITSPLYRRDEQTRAILKIAEKSGLSDLVTRLLGVLAENRRLVELSGVIAGFGALLADHRGEVSARVTTATALSDKQLAAIIKKLELFSGRQVTVDAEVDDELIGGLVVRLGSRMIDNSLKTKIDNLHIAMKEGE